MHANKAVGFAVKVRPLKLREKTKGGIILSAETHREEEKAVRYGIVLDKGSSAFQEYKDPEEVKIGDLVLFKPYHGKAREDANGERYLLMHYMAIQEVLDKNSISDLFEPVEELTGV